MILSEIHNLCFFSIIEEEAEKEKDEEAMICFREILRSFVFSFPSTPVLSFAQLSPSDIQFGVSNSIKGFR